MKKINFARAHQVLSEKEMKNVLGGSGSYVFSFWKNGRELKLTKI